MLTAIDRDLWIADGADVPFLGFPYPTRMTLARLDGGDLWVCSPVGLTEEIAAEVERLGPVRHLVSPNKIHHLFLSEWKRRWPEARLYASPGLPARRRDLAFDAVLGDEPEAAWVSSIDQVVFRGSFVMQEVAFFHRRSRTAIFTDLIQRFPSRPGLRGLYLRLDGLVGPNGSTPREWRWTFLRRRVLREAKRRVLAWNAERVIIAHGDWVREQGAEVLQKALRWMG